MDARRNNFCVPEGLKTEDDFYIFGTQTCAPGEHRNFLVQYIQLYSVWKISVFYEVLMLGCGKAALLDMVI